MKYSKLTRIIKCFRSKAHTRQAMLKILQEYRLNQIEGKIKGAEIMGLIQVLLNLRMTSAFRHLSFLMSTGLVDSTGESPNQILFLTEKGMAYLEGRTLVNEFWTRLESRFVNFSLVAANIILVIAFFAKDTETADAIRSLNTQMQNIEKGIKDKEIKVSLTLDTTGFHTKDSIRED